MARGTTLEQLIRMFRLEVGQSAQLAQGIQNKENIAQGLRRTQETLYYDFDWPFLRVYEYEQLQPGERVYTWPQNVKLEYVRQLYDQWGERWTPIGYGINFQLRNEYQPGETSDPVLAWQEVGPDQYEIIPTPSTSRYMAIVGYRTLDPLVADTDKAVLDDNMIVLFYAAEFLQRNKMADAQAKLAQAQRLKASLQGRLVSDKRRNVTALVGGVSPNAVYLPGPTRQPYGLPPPIPRPYR